MLLPYTPLGVMVNDDDNVTLFPNSRPNFLFLRYFHGRPLILIVVKKEYITVGSPGGDQKFTIKPIHGNIVDH